MKIAQIELIEIHMPLIHFFETSFGRTYDRKIILARVTDENGGTGWGECTCGELPSYSSEWTEACWETMEKVLAPMIVGQEISAPEDTWKLLKDIKGNRMSKATIDNAIWDLSAKNHNIPLWKHLGGTRDELVTGVSIGIQDSVEQLLEKIKVEVEAGYRRIKIKIAPNWDFDIVEKVRAEYPDILLMADANSAYSLDDIELFKTMDQFDLMMFEQPLSHDDIFDHAELQRAIDTPICLDESIHSPDDARKAIEHGSCKIINIKLGRVGGHTQARAIQEVAMRAGMSVWCGGMLEAGIGRAHNIAMSTLEGFTLPGDISASKRYWHEDIIVPQVEVSENGTIAVPEAPGIGFEINEKRIDDLAVRRKVINPA